MSAVSMNTKSTDEYWVFTNTSNTSTARAINKIAWGWFAFLLIEVSPSLNLDDIPFNYNGMFLILLIACTTDCIMGNRIDATRSPPWMTKKCSYIHPSVIAHETLCVWSIVHGTGKFTFGMVIVTLMICCQNGREEVVQLLMLFWYPWYCSFNFLWFKMLVWSLYILLRQSNQFLLLKICWVRLTKSEYTISFLGV
jgi:hypothetical protein